MNQGSNGSDGTEQLSGLFNGLNMAPSYPQGKPGVPYGDQQYPFGQSHQGYHQHSGPFQYAMGIKQQGAVHNTILGPVMDIAEGDVMTQTIPLTSAALAHDPMYRPAATFPHMNVHPASLDASGYQFQQQHIDFTGNSSISQLSSYMGYDGVAPQTHFGWGGQAIEGSQAGYKNMWFGRGQQGRVPKGPYNGNGRRGKSRGRVGNNNGKGNGRPSRSSDGSGFGSEISVDSVASEIFQIPKGQQINDQVIASLKSLDSRAFASLLKELSRSSLSSRSVEIFDTIRQLPHDDILAVTLLDVFSYTAAISLCMASHSVERALELAAEMKKKKIQCNVHTYTALMNVCIKCSRYGTALETYETMRKDGCIPNVVTFNTLVDVYGKTGAWQQAIEVLDIMRKEGVDPVLRTYNTLLIACNMCNQPREAITSYKRMLDEGFTPNSTTYNALISAYGKSGQLDMVMEVFQEMTVRGCERNVITYSSLISACEKAGQWELALELFQEMVCIIVYK